MAYKGDDLDLRAPQSRGAMAPGYPTADPDGGPAPARVRARQNGNYQNGSASAHRSPALYVDEILLACCNHAYDIASANGAREVLLEHLVHALTRIPEAAQILEARGVHVMALRRESAGIIANDLPISPSDSGTQARASSDFDAVLHLAAANARLRSDRPTSVRDVLFVLMNYDRQASGIDLLRRHWASWQQDDGAERDDAPAPRMAQPLAREPRLEIRQPVYEAQPVVERIIERVEAPSRNDRMAEARLEALVNSLHDSVSSQRADTQNLRSTLGDRLHRLEKAIENGRQDNNTTALEMAITARLQRLEKMQESLLAQRVSLAPLEAAMNDRFHRLDKTLEASRLDHGKMPAAVADRFQVLERMLEARLTDMQRTITQSASAPLNGQLGDRLQRLEKSIEGVTHAMPSGLIDRMQAMETSFETKISEGTRTWGTIGERLQGLERSLQAHRAEVAHLQASTAQVHNVLNERAQGMERTIDTWRQESAAASARVPAPLLDRLSALETMLTGWRDEGGGSVSGGEVPAVLFERLQSLERSLLSVREDSARLAKTNETAIGELRAGMMRLTSVQQTLAAGVEEWRLDNAGNLGIISNKLEAIEHSTLRPMEMLESLNARLQAMSAGMGSGSASVATGGGYGSNPSGGQVYQTQAPAGSMGGGLGGGSVLQTSTTSGFRHGGRRGFWRWLFGLR